MLHPRVADLLVTREQSDKTSWVHFVDRVSENEVIAAWVTAESTSDRFGASMRKARERGAATPTEILARARGWPDQGYFQGFPRDVEWWHATLTRRELLSVHYINWGYWLDVSDGSRLPADAIVKMGWNASPGLLPDEVEPIVVVRDTRADRIVVLEGHARLTNFVIAQDKLPAEIPCLLGLSPNMANWGCY